MDLIAFALRAEYDGTVEQDGEQVPKFGGGVLFVGDGDIHIRDELEAGGGVITCRASDSALVALLDAYPALKRATTNPAHVISPYARRETEALRFDADLRGLRQAGSLSRARLVKALEAHDAAQEVSLAEAAKVADQLPDVDPDDPPEGDDGDDTGGTGSDDDETKGGD